MSWSGKNQVSQGAITHAELEESLRRVGAPADARPVPKGAILFWQGQECKNQYYVVDGMVEIFATDASGRKKIVDFYGPGSLVGFQILRSNNLPMTTARVIADSSVIAITKKTFYEMFRGNPDFAEKVLHYLFGLLQMQTSEVISSSFLDTLQRVALLLLSLTVDAPEGALSYGNTDIADMLGVSRNSVTAALAHLQKQGIVAKGRGQIEVLDAARLESVAGNNLE